jgi:benzoyl-CoA reductase/2-hydroxyglutaryl-CoA dehydratase subunit BcrC/BadD/HgdB
MSRETTSQPEEIRATARLKQVMAQHFRELDEAARKGNPRIAWCTSVGPAELLRAMGFLVYFPENHGAMLGATRKAMDYIPIANAMGYSPDICSYLTSDVGAYLLRETPLSKAYGMTGVPRPDLLVYNTNQCRDVQDWFQYYGREFGVPVVGITSPRAVEELKPGHVEDVARQMKSLVPVLEERAGHPLDMDELKRVMSLSRRCSDLWLEVLETAAAMPSPWTFFDHTIHMGPAVVARGTQEAVDYYELLLQEMRGRIQAGAAAVDGERHRLYWEGMPIWGKLRDLSNLFSRLRACIVASTYCNSWIFTQFDPDDPFLSMARAYTDIFICHGEVWKERYIQRMVRDYQVDGIIFHDARTCPNNSNSRYGMPQRIEKQLGVPCLVLQGDLNDLRCYSEEQARTNIEAFIEQLEENAGK